MKIGIIGDLHEPFVHPLYLRFCLDIFDSWGVEKIHFIGDIVDNHAISFHKSETVAYGSHREGELAEQGVARWYKTFPRATVSIGNHDELPDRIAQEVNLPPRFLRTYQEAWKTPNWDWKFSHNFDGTRLQHGTKTSGKDAAINQALQRRTSLAQGHIHGWASVKWHCNDDDRIFGMNVGCGIDVDAYSMRYGKDFANRPVLACGVIIDGHPYLEAMPCGPGEKYHRSRA